MFHDADAEEVVEEEHHSSEDDEPWYKRPSNEILREKWLCLL